MTIWMWLERVTEDEFSKYDAKILDFFFLNLKINYKDKILLFNQDVLLWRKRRQYIFSPPIATTCSYEPSCSSLLVVAIV